MKSETRASIVATVPLTAILSVLAIITNYLDSAINDMKSQNSDPDNECGLDDDLDLPPEFYNEFEKDFKFVFPSSIHPPFRLRIT